MTAKLPIEYHQDFYAWTIHNAELMRQGRFSEIDIENIAEELESLGKRDKREFMSCLTVVMAHLLKWQLQPSRRSKSWKYTIKEQRIRLIKLLQDSPSLHHEIDLKLAEAYQEAIVMAISETGLDETDFPKESPFNLNQCLDADFYPGSL